MVLEALSQHIRNLASLKPACWRSHTKRLLTGREERRGEREGARGVRERENEESSQPSFVISNTAVTSHMQLFKFKLIKMIKFKNLLFSHTSHISSA